MNKLIVAAASAALFASTALASAQETQGTEGGAQEEMIKKPKAKSGTEATPRQQQQTGETEQQPAPGQQDQQTGETEQQPEPGQQEQQSGEAEGQPSTETTGSIDINTEQRTEITQVIREEKADPVDVDFDVNVGVAVPR